MQEKKKNIIAENWEKRIGSLPQDIRIQLEELKETRQPQYEFIPIKTSRNTINKGDIFVIQPKKDIYFLGQVLNTDVSRVSLWNNQNYVWRNAIVICIFKNKIKELNLPNINLNYEELLIAPSIIIKEAWDLGCFYTIGNIPLTKEEQKLDYGFFDTTHFVYRDEYGCALNHKPKIVGILGICNYGAIEYDINCEAIIDPSLFD